MGFHCATVPQPWVMNLLECEKNGHAVISPYNDVNLSCSQNVMFGLSHIMVPVEHIEWKYLSTDKTSRTGLHMQSQRLPNG